MVDGPVMSWDGGEDGVEVREENGVDNDVNQQEIESHEDIKDYTI